MNPSALWVIRAGKHDEAKNLFLNEKNAVLALGWNEMPDLSTLPPDRESFKSLVAKTYPTAKPGVIPNYAGQLFRFIHEMKEGDKVLYPCKSDRMIYFGTVSGKYVHKQESKPFAHHRAVNWIKSIPRTKFSQGALYEIGSALTVFQVSTFAEEVFGVFQGQNAPVPVTEDPTVAQVQIDIQDTTRDFVIKTLAQQLKGHPFADFVAHLLSKMGYRTRVSPAGNDGGIDIIAHKDELGFEPPIIKVQVKSGEATSIGDPLVAALYGRVDKVEFGLFVTLGTFINQAKQFAKAKSNLRLIDGNELVDLIFTHYDRFDSRYKAVLPLKRVYVPDPEEATEE